MRPRPWWLLIVVAALAAAAPLHATSSSVTLDALPVAVAPGGVQHVSAIVVGSASCSARVRYSDGTTQALGAKRVATWRVAWTWRVKRNAASGTATLTLACGGAGRARTSFKVMARLEAARIAVVETGLTQTVSADGSGSRISYGIVLENMSSNEDAQGVQVGVNLLDGAGRVVGSDVSSVAAIPAGATWYFGGEAGTRNGTRIVRVQPVVHVSAGKPKAVVAPAAANVRVTASAAGGGAFVDGQLTSGQNATLSRLARISAVFFDRSGNVVGGGETSPPFDLPPGVAAAFEIATPVQATAIASVQVSVEPRYGA